MIVYSQRQLVRIYLESAHTGQQNHEDEKAFFTLKYNYYYVYNSTGVITMTRGVKI